MTVSVAVIKESHRSAQTPASHQSDLQRADWDFEASIINACPAPGKTHFFRCEVLHI